MSLLGKTKWLKSKEDMIFLQEQSSFFHQPFFSAAAAFFLGAALGLAAGFCTGAVSICNPLSLSLSSVNACGSM